MLYDDEEELPQCEFSVAEEWKNAFQSSNFEQIEKLMHLVDYSRQLDGLRLATTKEERNRIISLLNQFDKERVTDSDLLYLILVYSNSIEISKFLIGLGAEIEYRTITSAIERGLVDLVNFYCDFTDNKNDTKNNILINDLDHTEGLLSVAAANGNLDLVKRFEIKYSKFVSEVDYELIIAAAVAKGHVRIIRHYVEVEKVTLSKEKLSEHIFNACHYEQINVLKYLVEELGGKMDFVDGRMENCLFEATKMGDIEIVRYVIENGTIDINKTNQYRQSVVYVCCEFGHLEILKLLVSEGADLNKAGSAMGKSPLLIACQYQRLDVVKYLVEQGVSVRKNALGAAALKMANSVPLRDYLIEQGANETSDWTPDPKSCDVM